MNMKYKYTLGKYICHSIDCVLVMILKIVLFQMKKDHVHEEAISNDVVGQAHLENHALQMFLYADNEDRAGRFGKLVTLTYI